MNRIPLTPGVWERLLTALWVLMEPTEPLDKTPLARHGGHTQPLLDAFVCVQVVHIRVTALGVISQHVYWSETVPLTGQCLAAQLDWLARKSQRCFSLPLPHWDYMGTPDLNSGPHACMVSTSPTEPFAQVLTS